MARPKSTLDLSRASYSDVAPLFDLAVEHGGVRHEFLSESQAINKCHRLNKWRIYNRSAGNFKYDLFIVRRVGVAIEIIPRDALQGVTTTLDGVEVKPRKYVYPCKEEREILSFGITKGEENLVILEKLNKWRVMQGMAMLTEEQAGLKVPSATQGPLGLTE